MYYCQQHVLQQHDVCQAMWCLLQAGDVDGQCPHAALAAGNGCRQAGLGGPIAHALVLSRSWSEDSAQLDHWLRFLRAAEQVMSICQCSAWHIPHAYAHHHHAPCVPDLPQYTPCRAHHYRIQSLLTVPACLSPASASHSSTLPCTPQGATHHPCNCHPRSSPPLDTHPPSHATSAATLLPPSTPPS